MESEHVWRCHAPLTQCPYCEVRWPDIPRKSKLPQVRGEHIPQCRENHGGLPRVIGVNDVEIMTESQQEAFCKVKLIRDPPTKMRAMYRALGKSQPDTYRE